MSMPIVYIDHSDIKPGMGADLRLAVSELVEFVEGREPRLAHYAFHLDDAASAMSVVAVHPDSASLELHLAVGGPGFAKVGAFITLRSIEIFGVPSPTAVQQVHAKAAMLGGAHVAIHEPIAGFTRINSASG